MVQLLLLGRSGGSSTSVPRTDSTSSWLPCGLGVGDESYSPTSLLSLQAKSLHLFPLSFAAL